MYQACGGVVFFSLCLIFLVPSCSGGNILVYPVDGSHWINMKILLEELHARGHNITVIRASSSWYIKEKSPLYSSINLEMEEAFEDFFDIFVAEQIKVQREGASMLTFLKLNRDFLSMLTQAHVLWCDVTKDIFENKTLAKQIIDSKSDFVFDFPRPTMPNVVYIGGFQCKPAEPLPADLEKFVQSSGEHGVIIMTLGTLVNALPKDIADEIAMVFSKMPQKVIWKHKGDRPSTLGSNTLLVDWMPQKDLLGHPQVKVFVAHGGTNGVQEAIYHGVPVLGIPLFFDQYDNLLRLQERGAGKIIQLADLNSHTFEEGQWGKLDRGSFWIVVLNEYPHLALRANEVLLPFTTTYLCESGFSTVATTKTRLRASLEATLRVSLSPIPPRLDLIMSQRQAQVSH
ncbi:hypothetical protein OJAV_G00141330 [Oryzias javanicus]|uniref:UDP-glucuronosyltransferase n=1 Tax=Oryzias javanicus TaxID=123683 RepID=A0A437CMZ0_ORYJA|nr:hypothetical protein OJAV_G00141330 [Oryzias javanicus]